MTSKRKLAILGAGAVAAVGAGAALASNGHGAKAPGALRSAGAFVSSPFGPRMHMGMHGGDDLAAAASYLGLTGAQLQADLQSGKTLAQVADATAGKSAADLIAALVAHEKQELAAAVTAGRLTQAQADALTPTIQQRVTDMVNGVRPAFPGGPGPRGLGGGLAAAASYLGLTAAQLQSDLQSGKTLAQVADGTAGKSAAGLIAALVAHAKQDLAAAVAAGRLTQAQADALTPMIQQRVSDMVNGVRPAFPGGHRGWGWGGGVPRGPGSWAGSNA